MVCLSQRAEALMSQRRSVPLLLLYTNKWQWWGWNSAAVITSVRSSMFAGLMSTISEKQSHQGTNSADIKHHINLASWVSTTATPNSMTMFTFCQLRQQTCKQITYIHPCSLFIFRWSTRSQPKFIKTSRKKKKLHPILSPICMHRLFLSVLFVVVLCGSEESVLPCELFKLVFHRCLYDFLGQLPFEWGNHNMQPVPHATTCTDYSAL